MPVGIAPVESAAAQRSNVAVARRVDEDLPGDRLAARLGFGDDMRDAPPVHDGRHDRRIKQHFDLMLGAQFVEQQFHPLDIERKKFVGPDLRIAPLAFGERLLQFLHQTRLVLVVEHDAQQPGRPGAAQKPGMLDEHDPGPRTGRLDGGADTGRTSAANHDIGRTAYRHAAFLLRNVPVRSHGVLHRFRGGKHLSRREQQSRGSRLFQKIPSVHSLPVIWLRQCHPGTIVPYC